MKRPLSLIAPLLLSTPLLALELKSADVHNSEDYPTVAAVRHLGQLLAKSSGGALTVKVFNKGALGQREGDHRPGQDRRAGDDPRAQRAAERDVPEDA